MSLSNQSFWHVLFHARVNEKRFPDHLRFAFWNKMIKLRRQFVQNHDTRKKKLFQNLQWLLSCTLMSTEKPRFCRFEDRSAWHRPVKDKTKNVFTVTFSKKKKKKTFRLISKYLLLASQTNINIILHFARFSLQFWVTTPLRSMERFRFQNQVIFFKEV